MNSELTSPKTNDEEGMSHFLLEEDFRGEKSSSKISRKYKRVFYFIGAFALLATVILLIVFLLPRDNANNVTPPLNQKHQPYNVILLIGDGFGPAAATMARVTSGKSNLSFDPYLMGTLRTFSSSSWVTDSAASATAYSTGFHTYNGAIGVDPNGKPLGTMIEAAQQRGMRSGLVVTTRLSDATPAAFFSHALDRSMEPFIIDQILNKSIDVILGGGASEWTQTNLNDAMGPGRYTFVSNRTSLLEYTNNQNSNLNNNQLNPSKLLGLFYKDNIPLEIDRLNPKFGLAETIPSLSEMTAAALSVLSKHSYSVNNENKGFFLMVEGSKIDVCGHFNDAAGQIRETMAFQDAYQLAIDFANKDGNTIVLMTADHETGGLTLGYQPDMAEYPKYAWYPGTLNAINASSSMMAQLIVNATANQQSSQYQSIIYNIISQYTPINITLTQADYTTIINYLSSSSLNAVIGKILSSKANIGFTTFGHTGVDVNLYGYYNISKSPNSKPAIDLLESIKGNHENIQLANIMESLMGLNLTEITNTLTHFIPHP